MNPKSLQQFLIDSNNAGYASGEEKQWIKEKDESTTIPFEKGDFKSHDNFFGGEPYGGRVVVFYKNKPVWIMVYYGWIIPGYKADPIYAVLKNALKKMPEDAPFRGPKKYQQEKFTYLNTWNGDIEQYAGEEKIFQKEKLIYKANYLGGLVDQKI